VATAARAVREGTIDEALRIHLHDLLDIPQSSEFRSVFDAMDGAARSAGYRAAVLQLVERVGKETPLSIAY